MSFRMSGPVQIRRVAVWAILIACCFVVGKVIAQADSPLVDDIPFMNPSGPQGSVRIEPVVPIEAPDPVPGFTPTNVNVSNLDGNESEVSIAVNPTNPMNMVIHGHGPHFGHVNTFFTMDGGQTWSRVPLGDAYDGEDGTGCGRVNPTVTFDDNGVCYLSYLTAGCDNARRVLFVARSDDGGQTYNPPVVVADHNDGRVDKEFIGTGPDPGNPAQQNVYLAYRLDVGQDAQLHVATSTDGGQTFSDVIINDESIAGWDFAAFGVPAVGPNGEVYVVWDDQTDRPNSSEIMVDVSYDGGTTWGTDVSVGTTGVARGNTNRYDITAQPDRGILAVPSIAADRSGGPNNGRVYITYTVVGDGGFDDTDVVLHYSNDNAQTWSAPLTVNDDGGSGSQFLPWLTVDNCNDGKVAIAWLDTRNDPTNAKVQAFLGVSEDGGLTIEPNIQIASGQSDQSVGNPLRTVNNYLGNIGIGACNDVACLAWPDNSVILGDLDYFSDCACLSDVVLTCPGDITVECTTNGGVPKANPEVLQFLGGVSGSGCGGNFEIANDAPLFFPLGTNTVTFTATDISGNETTCSADVVVEDTTPPEIRIIWNRYHLWPPNHEMVNIWPRRFEITDVCDPDPQWVLESIASDEDDNGNGDGNTTGDIDKADFETQDRLFQLRAERSGKDDGRRYTIIYRAWDSSGNVARDTSVIHVPHDQNISLFGASGFSEDGTRFAEGARAFTVVIPSTAPVYKTRGSRAVPVQSAVVAAELDPSDIYIGNTAGELLPARTQLKDVNNDGLVDLLVTYDTTPASEIPVGEPTYLADGSITVAPPGYLGLHFLGHDDQPYLAANIFALGAPITERSDEEYDRDIDTGIVGGRLSGADTPKQFDTELASIYPNPFNPQTTIRFTLAAAGNVTIAVYDVNGALVKTLVDNVLPGGEHIAEWNGTDAQGRSVATGVYFTRMVTGNFETTRKMVLVK